ncbi:MAG: EAL domain-containing protein [Herminiimonas sp.]|nr:EAL domain-containing protein [Herminiimonas sp.]
MSLFTRIRFNLDSLRSRLLLLVALSLVPPIVLTIFGAMRERQHAIAVAESDLQRLTGLAATSEAKTIEGARQFLIALSGVPDLVGDPARCSALLQTMLKKNIGFLNLGVADKDGEVRCSAVPLNSIISMSDRTNFKKTVASGKFATSDYVFGRVVRKHAINASYPIFDNDGRIVAVVFAAIDLNTLDQFANDIEFPPNAILITADANGTIIARRPDPQQWIGTRVAPALMDGMVKVGFGTAEITGADGVPRLHAFAPVGGPDLSSFTVSIGIPAADIVATANKEQSIELLALMVTAALALLTAWFAANVTIIGRLHTVVDAAKRIAGGDLATRTGMRYGREEISELARAFDQMADALQRSALEHIDAQTRLFAEKERAEVTLKSIGDAVITTDRAGGVDYLNPVAEALTGWRTEEARGVPLSDVFNVINGTTREPLPSLLSKAPEQGHIDGVGRDSVLLARDGSEHAIEDSAAPIRDRELAVIGTVVVFHDVSQSRNLARQLSHQASHDPLTGLVNRREFERRLQLLLEQSATQPRQHALLFLDLDRFKVVNDTCGHNAGDELLRQITALLQPRLRDSDTFARVGGDEFAVLLENCTVASAAKIAEKLCKTVCDFRFACLDQIFPIGVSIGLVPFSNDDMSMLDLLTAADGSCYQAKDEGRNRVHQYSGADNGVIALRGEQGWQARLQQAIATGSFMLLSQEIQALGALGRPVPQYEILLRMVDANGNQVLPTAFLPAAERYGLMPAIDRWTMRHAFAHHATLQVHPAAYQPSNQPSNQTSNQPSNPADLVVRQAPARIVCAIGISASALNDPQFIVQINALFDEFLLPHASVCFQVAETTAIAHLSKTMQFIDAMKPRGCLFALDDFGSGMSSFAYLSHLRVDFLKIDGAFITNMANDPIDRAKVEAINHIGHAMGIRTIAKHVEDQACVDKLRAIRVDHAQGNAIAAAVPVPVPDNNGKPSTT